MWLLVRESVFFFFSFQFNVNAQNVQWQVCFGISKALKLDTAKLLCRYLQVTAVKVRRNNSRSNVKSQVTVERKSKLCSVKSKATEKKEKNHTKTKPQPQTPSSQVESHKHTHTGLDEAEPMWPASGRSLIIPTEDTIRNRKETEKTKTKQCKTHKKKESRTVWQTSPRRQTSV